MTNSYLYFETSSHRRLTQQRARTAAPRHPAVPQRHRLASGLRRVADRLNRLEPARPRGEKRHRAAPGPGGTRAACP